MNDSSILFFFIQSHMLLILINFPSSLVESSSQYLIGEEGKFYATSHIYESFNCTRYLKFYLKFYCNTSHLYKMNDLCINFLYLLFNTNKIKKKKKNQ